MKASVQMIPWTAENLNLPARASIAPAHVRWFVESGDFPLRRTEVFSGVTLLALVVIAVAVGGAWVAARLAARWQLAARARVLATPLLARLDLDLPRPADLYAWAPAALALHTAVLLLVRGVERQLFVANLVLPYTLPAGLLALGEIVVALGLLGGLLVGALTRVAAAGLVALGLLGMVYFGPLLMLEHAYFFGIAAFLLIAGPGPGVGARLVRGAGRPWPALLPYAAPILLGSFGFATMLTGFTEKLWNRDLALAFLRLHPFNLTAATPFAVSDAHFVIGAGLAEAALGAVLLTRLWPRLAILAAWVPFNLAVPFLGWGDVVGHLPIYGIILVVLLCGAGHGFTAALLRHARPASAARPSAMPSQPRARRTTSSPDVAQLSRSARRGEH